jgi:transketolase
MHKEELLQLESIALNIRRNILRLIKAGQAGHVGGALSSVEILTALYFKLLHIDPENPKWPQRDRFVLSAGHKCLVLYAALAERGFLEPLIRGFRGIRICIKSPVLNQIQEPLGTVSPLQEEWRLVCAWMHSRLKFMC